MKNLQRLLENSIETGQDILFSDTEGKMWEISLRDDIDLPLDTEEDEYEGSESGAKD